MDGLGKVSAINAFLFEAAEMELNLRTRVKFFVNFHILPSPRINNRAIRDLEIWRLLVDVEISLEKFTEGGQFPEISSDFERRSNGKLAKISIKTWNFIFKLVEWGES